MTDTVLAVQKAVVAAIVADAALGALIGDRIYDEAPDYVTAVAGLDDVHDVTYASFPALISIDISTVEPWDRIGDDNIGWIVGMTLYIFSRGNGSVEAKQIGSALSDLLHRSELSIDVNTMGWCEHLGTTYDVMGDFRTHVGIANYRFHTHS